MVNIDKQTTEAMIEMQNKAAEFGAAWKQVELTGGCDSFGGMEYLRVWVEWRAYVAYTILRRCSVKGKLQKIVLKDGKMWPAGKENLSAIKFIQWRANITPQSPDWDIDLTQGFIVQK